MTLSTDTESRTLDGLWSSTEHHPCTYRTLGVTKDIIEHLCAKGQFCIMAGACLGNPKIHPRLVRWKAPGDQE